MGCFLGCFGGEKDQKRRRKRRNSRGSPQSQRNRVQNVHQETGIAGEVEQIVKESPPVDVVSELRNKPEAEEQPTPSPRNKVTFNSNITTYEHVAVHESTDYLPEHNKSVTEKEIIEDLKTPSRSNSLSEDDNSAVSSVASYPPNHRYHNARESDDEYEEFGDSDLDDIDDEEEDYDDYDEQLGTEEVWSAVSMESRTGNPSREEFNQEVDSGMVNDTSRNGCDHGNSVLNPVENINQWKAAKSKGRYSLKTQKENLTSNFESPRLSFSYEPVLKSKLDQTKNVSQELAVDASLSNWLSPEMKKASLKGLETIESAKTMSEGSNSVTSFADRPILGALTVEELRQISVTSSPRKSPSRSPDEMAIIGTVGTYWNHSSSLKGSASAPSSYKGIPNTTSKYREDKRVTWHSTPFETRLDRALNRVTTES